MTAKIPRTKSKTPIHREVSKSGSGKKSVIAAPAAPSSAVSLDPNHSRHARALVGWLPPDAAHSAMAGPGVAAPFAKDVIDRAERARAAVAGRAPLVVDTGVMTPPPPALDDHIKGLEAQPFYRPYLGEGWRVLIADLAYVRALQPMVHCDHAAERTQGARADDLTSLAAITLPTSRPKEVLACEPDANRRRWILSCRNPHLRILGLYKTDLDDNGYKTKVFGFQTELAHSLVQVVHWRGAYVLRDGYHRTHGLLARGITRVPVIYREFPGEVPPMVAPNLFDPSVYMSERPPLLPDYLNEEVSAAIEVRRQQKIIIIEAVEIDPPIL